jgi:hypothetical protein
LYPISKPVQPLTTKFPKKNFAPIQNLYIKE